MRLRTCPGASTWPERSGQFAFGTLVLTLSVLYTFMAKGEVAVALLLGANLEN